MVVAAFPVFKLGALLLKQVSKPLANLTKARAKQSPFFRNYICMPPAQFYHWCEVKLKMWSMNLGKPVNIPKLNESAAIELGAELVGEAVVFSIASGILIFEYVRQSRKEAAKEAERLAQMELISNDLKTLYTQKAQQEAQIRELIRILEEKIPDSNFNPLPIDDDDLPQHHREAEEPEPSPGAFNTVKGWVTSAIDFVLPPVSNNPPENYQPVLVIQQKSDPSHSEKCKSEDKGKSSFSNTNTITAIADELIKNESERQKDANPKR